jgi:RsiW-degrading membrane proteinase PrsW (M82 family)
MIKKRLTAGIIFGVCMTLFIFALFFFTNDTVPPRPVMQLLQSAFIAGVLSGIIFGVLLGRFPKGKYP